MKRLLTFFLIVSFRLTFASDSLLVEKKTVFIKYCINTNNDSLNYALNELKVFANSKKNNNAWLHYFALNGFKHLKRAEFDDAIKNFEAYVSKAGDSLSAGSIDQLNRIALCYKQQRNPKAIDYYKATARLAEKVNYAKGIADSYVGYGQYLELQGKYEEALTLYLESIDLFEKNKDSSGISVSYLNIGTILFYQNQLDKALEYYKKSASIDLKSNSNKHLASAYGNIGMVFNELKMLDSALHYNLLCMQLFESMQEVFALGTIYNNIALVYYDKKDFNKSLEYHEKSKAIKEKIQDKNGLATSLINIGNVLCELKQFKSALNFYQSGLVLAKEIKSPNIRMNAHKGLSKAYGELKQFENALLEHIYFSDINDSLNNAEAKNKIAELETKFNSAEKEKQLLEQEKKYEAEKTTSLAQRKIQIVILVSVLVILAIVVVFLILLSSKLRVTKQQKEVIEEKNEENELLLAEIHHRVKNNLQMISSLLNLQQRDIENSEAKNAIIESRDRVRSMALLHKMLYQNDNFSGVELKDFTKTLVEELSEVSPIPLRNQLNIQPIMLDVESAVPIALILNELIVNSIKYAFTQIENPLISISISEINSILEIDYQDNGIGLSSENAQSFGTKLIQSLTKQLKGTYELSTQNGTRYLFQIKKYSKTHVE